MQRKTKVLIGAGALAALVAAGGTAIAEGRSGGHHGGPGGHGMMFMMEQVDADGDGKVTRAEVESWRKQKLAAFDKDGDGNLSLAEFKPLFAEMMSQPAVRAFQRLDRDGDGKITEAEQMQPMDRMFAKMDRNDDDALEAGEMHRERRGRHGERD